MVKTATVRKQKEKKRTGPKILSREELKAWWPFQRVDGKWLTKLHKQEKKSLDDYEESPV